MILKNSSIKIIFYVFSKKLKTKLIIYIKWMNISVLNHELGKWAYLVKFFNINRQIIKYITHESEKSYIWHWIYMN